MKKLMIFMVVGGLHIVVIGALLIHSGCQGSVSASPQEQETNRTVTSSSMTEAEIAREFNAIPVSSPSRAEKPTLFEPTRPKLVMEMDAQGARVPIETIPAGEVLAPKVNAKPVVIETVTTEEKVDDTKYQEYTVKSGDSLWLVAKRHGLSHIELAKLNNLAPKAGLKIGQVLRVPMKDQDLNNQVQVTDTTPNVPAPVESISGIEYVVKRGDNLTSIAKRNGTTIKAIKALSGISSSNLRVGQKLMIPQEANAPRVNSASSATQASSVTHVVRKGEYLSTIAKKYGVSVKDLVSMNNLANANSIRIGQKLVVREGPTELSVSTSQAAPTNKQEAPTLGEPEDVPTPAPELILPTPNNLLEQTDEPELDPLDAIEQNSAPIIIRRKSEGN